MAKLKIYNPQFGAVPAQTAFGDLPSQEGKIFKIDDPQGNVFGVVQGGKIYEFGSFYKDPSRTGLNDPTPYLQAGFSPEDVGLTSGGLPTYNRADLKTAFNLKGQSSLFNPASRDIFKNLSTAQIQDVVIGAPNAAPVEAFPGQFGGVVRASGVQSGGGMPQPTTQPLGTQILNRQDLIAKQQELARAGVPQNEWSKYISSPDAQGRLFYAQPATLTSPTGQKEIVASGSKEASDLLKTGWTLGGAKSVGGTILTSQDLMDKPSIDLGTGTVRSDTSLADRTAASIKVDVSETEKQIAKNLELLKTPESDLSKKVSELLGEAQTTAGELTGRGALQMSEEQKRGIEQQNQVIADKSTELKKKLAEFDTLTASYQLANQQEEGRPQTLSRLQGAQAQNYKMYLAQKNTLAAEAGYMQTELLGLQGKLDTAQKAADRAVELEFQDRIATNNANLQQLQLVMPFFEKEEKRYAEAVSLTLQQQAATLSEQKAAKKALTDFNLDMMAKYPDAGITLNDTTERIQSKVASSRIYQKATGLAGEGIVTDASGLSYDITTYATDPTHEAKVQSILNNIGKMTSVQQINAYIQQVAPGSPITGQMVANASQKHGVSWETIMAIMQQDSSFGTQGAGARSFNPGNVGNTEMATSTGQLVNFGSWQAGVDAVARNLARRKVTRVDNEVQGYVNLVKSGQLKPEQALDDISKNKKEKLAIELSKVKPTRDTLQNELARQKAQLAQELKTHKGLDSSVGPSILKIFTRFKLGPAALGARQDFIASVEQLLSGLSLESLIEAKSRGATFGALSDTEMRILASAASKLGTWKVTDDNGNVKGYNVSEKAFKRELDTISETLSRGINTNRKVMPDGTVWKQLGDGNFLLIE